jgi:hypothetical protein
LAAAAGVVKQPVQRQIGVKHRPLYSPFSANFPSREQAQGAFSSNFVFCPPSMPGTPISADLGKKAARKYRHSLRKSGQNVSISAV